MQEVTCVSVLCLLHDGKSPLIYNSLVLLLSCIRRAVRRKVLIWNLLRKSILGPEGWLNTNVAGRASCAAGEHERARERMAQREALEVFAPVASH